MNAHSSSTWEAEAEANRSLVIRETGPSQSTRWVAPKECHWRLTSGPQKQLQLCTCAQRTRMIENIQEIDKKNKNA